MSTASRARLGIVVAMPDEARPLLGRRATVGEFTALDQTIEVAVSGIGQIAAASAARKLVSNGATALLSWGTVGGLDPDLVVGSIVMPDRIVSDSGESLHVDRAWHARLNSRLAAFSAVQHAPLLSIDNALPDPARKRAAFLASKAASVDMESLAIGEVSAENSLPFLVLRVVVDTAGESIPRAVVNAMGVDGQISLPRLGAGLLRNPRAASDLIRLGRSFATARRALAVLASDLAPNSFLAPDAVRLKRKAAA